MEKKRIFPKCEQLRITMYFSALQGIWPLIFEDNPKLKKIYNIYSKISSTYFVLFSISVYIKLILIFTDKPLDVTELFLNLTLNFYFTVTIWRTFLFRGSMFQKLIKDIIVWEQRILSSGDRDIIKIYNYYVWQTKIGSKMYILFVLVGAVFFILHPLGLEPIIKYDSVKNQTKIIRPLPLSSWFPWDEQKYYIQSFLLHILDDSTASIFMASTETISYAITIFLLGQIVILNHILANFERYVLKIQDQLRVGVEEANFLTIRECILKHKEIIEHTNNFNKEMRIVALYDFLQSSLGLAAGVLNLVYFDVTPLNFAFFGTFVTGAFIRVLVSYWYANEIIIESSNTLTAIWNGQWYTEPKKTRKIKLIMMLRCSKPLYLDIGPFTRMSLHTLLRIVKATYSYMTVIYKTKK